jgi:hypothetical protein
MNDFGDNYPNIEGKLSPKSFISTMRNLKIIIIYILMNIKNY